MVRNTEQIAVAVAIVALAIFIGLSIDSMNVWGGNVNNETLVTKVRVSAVPDLFRVDIIQSPIDLTPGNLTTVNCTGQVFDPNGWDDIVKVNATIYDVAPPFGYNPDPSTVDNNYRYYNTSCNCSSADTMNASCSCLFNVEYFANNGTWQCNMSITDSTNYTDNMNSSYVTLSQIIGVGIPNEIDYGNLSVTQESNYIPANISNFGNVPINISTRGWGGTQPYSNAFNDTCMICDWGNISIYNERYSQNTSLVFGDMTNITNTSTGLPNYNLPVRTNDINYGNDTNITYWKLYIPPNVGGFCNGTIEFLAIETTI